MDTVKRILKGIDTFTRWQGYILAFFVVFLILITLYDIIFRQFGVFTMWAFDVEWFTYALIMMLAMGYAVLTKQHVRIDLTTERLPQRVQEGIQAGSYAIIVIPLIVYIAILSWDFAWKAMAINELTLIAWYAPIWPVKWFIWLGCILMLPQSFVELFRHGYFAVKGERL
ncbi:TRAP transporter small permease subunit [Chloroflexota bacterium]